MGKRFPPFQMIVMPSPSVKSGYFLDLLELFDPKVKGIKFDRKSRQLSCQLQEVAY